MIYEWDDYIFDTDYIVSWYADAPPTSCFGMEGERYDVRTINVVVDFSEGTQERLFDAYDGVNGKRVVANPDIHELELRYYENLNELSDYEDFRNFLYNHKYDYIVHKDQVKPSVDTPFLTEETIDSMKTVDKLDAISNYVRAGIYLRKHQRDLLSGILISLSNQRKEYAQENIVKHLDDGKSIAEVARLTLISEQDIIKLLVSEIKELRNE